MPDTPEYKDRIILVKFRKDGEEVTVQGVCVAHNPNTAFLVKPEKKAIPTLVPVEDVISVELVNRIEELRAVKLKEVKPYEVRRHLLNYHGVTLGEINDMTDEVAFDVHTEFHAKFGASLGHFHSNDK